MHQPTGTNPARPRVIDFAKTFEAASHGDEAAQSLLFARFYPTVERMVHRQLARDVRSTKPWLAARFSTGDVVQEVFRSVLKDLTAFEGDSEGAFAGYLARVVRNRIVDTIRFHEAARRDGRRSRHSVDVDEPAHESAEPSSQAVSAEELDAFHKALESFPRRERMLLRARIEDEEGFRTLANQLGYPSESAARRAFYAAQARLVLRLRPRLEG